MSVHLTEVSGCDDERHDAVGPPVALVDDAVVPSCDVALWKFAKFLWVYRVGRLPVGQSLSGELALKLDNLLIYFLVFYN